jgi:hypothetical protein
MRIVAPDHQKNSPLFASLPLACPQSLGYIALVSSILWIDKNVNELSCDVRPDRPLPQGRLELLHPLLARSLFFSFCWIKNNSGENKRYAQKTDRNSPYVGECLKKPTRKCKNENSFAYVCRRFGNELKFLIPSRLHLSASNEGFTVGGNSGDISHFILATPWQGDER